VPVDAWYDIIPAPTIADAILDRLVHNAHRIEMKGDSMRKKRVSSVLRECACVLYDETFRRFHRVDA